MSMRALHSSASGMESFLLELDNIANNLANSGTTGYKRTRTNFEDLFYEHLKVPGAITPQGPTPNGISVGLGTRVASTQLDFSEGSLKQTGKDLDIAIAGDGFFQVNDGTNTYYTRAGNFALNANNQVVLSSADTGRLLEPPITVPPDASEINISGDGTVTIRQAGSNALVQAGNITLVNFANPEGLLQEGENLFSETDASGVALIATPGLDGTGRLRQGFLELSNVEPVTELVDLIKTQRNVELNSQALQAGDQLLQLLVNLRRF